MKLPDHVRPIEKEARFKFKCHAGLKCFTDCCRELELFLTPYDVLRLRKALKLNSSQFMNNHAIVEFDSDDQFPRVYLGMVDDGRASCPFVKSSGCILYTDRPGACRTYPVGRGAAMSQNKKIVAKYVLLKEPHCFGFDDVQDQTIDEWEKDQEIRLYNNYNDLLMSITQHPKIRGNRLSQKQADLYIKTLYYLDDFREDLKNSPPPADQLFNYNIDDILSKDTILLEYAIKWLSTKLL